MRRSPCPAVDSLASVGLAELDACAALQDRVDRKYVIGAAELDVLAEHLRATHVALEIDGRRAFSYRSTYFDTPELRIFRDHVQRRRRRYKCRTREYVDSGLCVFEVKLKGSRGRTVKHRTPVEHALHDGLSEYALAFLRDCLGRSYGRDPDARLQPMLTVAYTRMTLAAPAAGERLTCDFGLCFSAPDGTSGRLADDRVIVESKSAGGTALADRVLRSLGARPLGTCSKYCLGIGFTNPAARSNEMRPLLRRHFRAAPLAAAALALAGAAPATAADVPRLDIRAAKVSVTTPRYPHG